MNAGDNVDDERQIGFSESNFKIAPTNIDEYTNNKLLNLQQENTQPHRNLDINDKIPDEKCQNNKIDEENLMKEIRSVQLAKEIEDEETVQLQNLSTDIEDIKELDSVESDKSDTEERENIQISDKEIMIDRTKKMITMIKLIKMLIMEQVKKNQREKIR